MLVDLLQHGGDSVPGTLRGIEVRHVQGVQDGSIVVAQIMQAAVDADAVFQAIELIL